MIRRTAHGGAVLLGAAVVALSAGGCAAFVLGVFDHEGRFLATVRFRATFRPRAASGRSMYGVLRDSLDVEHIARFTLPQTGRTE